MARLYRQLKLILEIIVFYMVQFIVTSKPPPKQVLSHRRRPDLHDLSEVTPPTHSTAGLGPVNHCCPVCAVVRQSGLVHLG